MKILGKLLSHAVKVQSERKKGRKGKRREEGWGSEGNLQKRIKKFKKIVRK